MGAPRLASLSSFTFILHFHLSFSSLTFTFTFIHWFMLLCLNSCWHPCSLFARLFDPLFCLSPSGWSEIGGVCYKADFMNPVSPQSGTVVDADHTCGVRPLSWTLSCHTLPRESNLQCKSYSILPNCFVALLIKLHRVVSSGFKPRFTSLVSDPSLVRRADSQNTKWRANAFLHSHLIFIVLTSPTIATHIILFGIHLIVRFDWPPSLTGWKSLSIENERDNHNDETGLFCHLVLHRRQG
jgi:hypothetical protein